MPGFSTKQLHADGHIRPFNAHAMPIVQTSTFYFDSPQAGEELFRGQREGYVYTRMGNPTVEAVEKVIASLENGDEAVAFGSGMAAVQGAILSAVKAGDHVIAGETLYGPCIHLISNVFSDLGIESSIVDVSDPDVLRRTIRDNTRLVFYETPANPTNKITDIALTTEIAKSQDVLTCVDNTFATPYFQRPLEHGADISLHSVTKYMNGHGDVIGGVAVARTELAQKIRKYRKNTGACMSPFDSYLLLRGVRSLSLRMERHHENTMKVFEFLRKHPKIERVFFPGDPEFPGHEVAKRQMSGCGGCCSFEVVGGLNGAKRLLQEVKLCLLAVSLGTIDTLIQHPASMTHACVPEALMRKQGVTPEMVRISVGCEDVQDIISDLSQALEHI